MTETIESIRTRISDLEKTMTDTTAPVLSTDAQAIIAAIEKGFANGAVVAPKSPGVGAEVIAEIETVLAKAKAGAVAGESMVGHIVSATAVKAGIPRYVAWLMIGGDIAAVAMAAKMFGFL